MQFKDHLTRTIELNHQPQRIISLVPSLTELLHDLGLEKRIIGITKFCVHPIHYKSTKNVVGGTKKVDIELIKHLNPDFILCSKEENTAEIVEELEKISPLFVSDINSFPEALKFIKEIGTILGKRTESQLMVDKINHKYHDFVKVIEHTQPIKSAYFIWKNPWMVAGSPTFINDMMRINRMENVFAHKGRYPEINIKHLKLQGNPELLLFSSEPYHFKDDDVYEVLIGNEKILSIYVDGRYFSWYGSRLLKTFDYFKTLHKRIADHE